MKKIMGLTLALLATKLSAGTPSVQSALRLSVAEQNRIRDQAWSNRFSDTDEVAALFKKLAIRPGRWQTEALEALGDLYRRRRDWAAAHRWWEKYAVVSGDSRAYGWIADNFAWGFMDLPKNYARAKFWYEKGAAAGDASAYGSIGYLYKRGGPGLDRDWEQACHYYRRAGPKWRREAREVCPTLPYLFIDTLRSPIFWGLFVVGTAIGLLTALAHRRRPRTDPDRPGPVI